MRHVERRGPVTPCYPAAFDGREARHGLDRASSSSPHVPAMRSTPPVDAPLYVINLDGSPARLESIRGQLDRLGCAFERIPAVHGASLTSDERAEVYSPALNRSKYRTPLTDGELGCYLSHRLAWQTLLASSSEQCVVIEDDALVGPRFPELVALAGDLRGFDVVKIAHADDCPSVESVDLSAGFRVVSYRKIPNCTTAYVISRRGAEKLLARAKVFRPVDVDLQFRDELGLSLVGVLPNVVSADHSLGSDIVQINGGRHRMPSRPLRNLRYRFALAWRRLLLRSADLPSGES